MFLQLLKNRAIAGLLSGVIITVFVLILGLILKGQFNLWHLKIADSLYIHDQVSDDIVIVAIDDKSVEYKPKGLGRYLQWTRDNYAKALEAIIDAEPKVIAFDILFKTNAQIIQIDRVTDLKNSLEEQPQLSESEKNAIFQDFLNAYSDPENNKDDNSFITQLNRIENLVLEADINDISSNYPHPKFRENAALGFVNSIIDTDGKIRRQNIKIQDKNDTFESFAITVAKEYLDTSDIEDLNIPSEDNTMMLNYFGDIGSFKTISLIDIIYTRDDLRDLKDKIVLIGITSEQEVSDTFETPTTTTQNMPGVEVHANAIQTILDQKFLLNQSRFSQILTILLISITLSIALNYLGVILSTILTIAAIALYILAAHLFFKQGLILNMVYPFIAILLTYLAAWVYRYFIADKGKREITGAFGKYVSKELVKEISKNPDQVQLGGEKRVITVFFSDIQASTTFSEETDIQAWVAQINEYFTVMENVIQKVGGTLDKYEGDAIMGFWNAPLQQSDHTLRAYIAALEMQKMLKTVLHPQWQKAGKPLIEFRIGINTGEAIVGNFGSANRFDYTVMGDTVNTASRLESAANKSYGTSIIVANFEKTLTPEHQKQTVIRELDTVFLPGKKEAQKVYELVCFAKDLTAEMKATITNYQTGLLHYRQKDFETAIKFFEASPNDTPSKTMLNRCQKLHQGGKISTIDDKMVYRILNK